MATRRLPNILITGTPGTGKTTLSDLVAIQTEFEHIEVGKLVKERQLHDGIDHEFDSFILNDDKLLDELEIALQPGGKIVDFHGCDLFPERWFDLVVVLQTDNTTLYDRLERRGYTTKKIQENVECEIMQVIVEEARESYAEHVVVILESTSVQQMEENAQRIAQWIQQYVAQHHSA
ncbi:hypothetical protein IWQ61_002770 [Dispira simplex]|nr:hypothetical protein IWQ61_002770 [Dispira simplex]